MRNGRCSFRVRATSARRASRRSFLPCDCWRMRFACIEHRTETERSSHCKESRLNGPLGYGDRLGCDFLEAGSGQTPVGRPCARNGHKGYVADEQVQLLRASVCSQLLSGGLLDECENEVDGEDRDGRKLENCRIREPRPRQSCDFLISQDLAADAKRTAHSE